ncbi:hydroxymethylbilane synthase [Cellulomonas fimi]|uniref:Porphobilinogen deaminase n=1 Tax=Cellulomonas fimi (strain ATCC 484 / DSM 20113 / JCM 1341 / CCUG 24087 / LMG 16345 / NBRC 15513 / NCIMB 8980 / NCTC 7547 / NRS-133) TaxID=590998 RepID=F4H671_CELFA|nr:hydroxymethylbilane synthase [Cellulomonas fimi]AEE44383.1 porphobilinogen deaminase [Cellulomonas fimi ATCC 484]NNH08908.1 hydroxymethylbilane synthase [Cellulomonas fimi]VEH26250.1 Porphobilinogen deaminase [Cellulomonas fimi]
MPQQVRIGTRASTLALTQTGHVADALAAHGGLAIETVRVRTDGDRLTGSLASLGGAGVFVTALRDALLDGRCDVAVHSLKDLPTADAPGLVLAAVPPREDPRDALCARDGLTLADLPRGARVGTGSPRRAAQLLAARPDLDVVDIRGNVDTRLGRVAGSPTGPGDLDAVVLARAGLARIGRLEAVTELFGPDVMLPAPGQGALAVETRAAGLTTDLAGPLHAALAALDDRPTRLAVLAERALLARLEAGCAAPVGTLATLDADGTLTLDAVVVRTDGTASLRRRARTALPGTAAQDVVAARALGTDLADALLADGAADLADLGASR